MAKTIKKEKYKGRISFTTPDRKPIVWLGEIDYEEIPDPEHFPQRYLPYFADPRMLHKTYMHTRKVEFGWPFAHIFQRGVAIGSGGTKLKRYDRYVEKLTEALAEWDTAIFAPMVKYVWIKNRFFYLNKSVVSGDALAQRAFTQLVRRRAGYEPHLLHGELLEDIKDLMCDIHGSDGFLFGSIPGKTIARPFPNLPLCCYTAIKEIDERLSLLKYANEQKMTYPAFLDYVYNWIQGFNAKYGERYLMLRDKEGLLACVVDTLRPATSERDAAWRKYLIPKNETDGGPESDGPAPIGADDPLGERIVGDSQQSE